MHSCFLGIYQLDAFGDQLAEIEQLFGIAHDKATGP